jgi:ferrous iron transport protein A
MLNSGESTVMPTPLASYPLTFAQRGQKLLLVDVHAGEALKRRLADLGLTIGTTLYVVQSMGHGPLIVAVRNDSRLALGRGMAHKIMVRPVMEAAN